MGTYKIQICKNAENVIFEDSVYKKDNDEDFTLHNNETYKNIDSITDSDFQKLFNYELPPRNIKKGRPFSLDNNLEDVKETFIGKILYKMVLKEAAKINKADDKDWITNVVNNTIGKTPLRTIATMSGKVSLRQMQAIVDLMNHKIIKGLLKIWW